MKVKIIRWVLGRFILVFEFLTTPKGVVRGEIEQDKVDKQTENYSLYQFKACPFCVKVRKIINKNSLTIEYRDAKNDEAHRQELETKGGKIKVPCLRILKDDGGDEWLYESQTIIAHLEEVAAAA